MKKCRNISVGMSPIFSRLNPASHTKPRATAEVEAHLAETIVHRKGIAVAFDAALAS